MSGVVEAFINIQFRCRVSVLRIKIVVDTVVATRLQADRASGRDDRPKIRTVSN